MTVWTTIRRSPRRRGLHPASFWLAAALLVAGCMDLQVQAQVPLPALANRRIQLTDFELPLGFVGMPFNSSVTATGGSGLYSILVGGQLPPGVELVRGGGTVAITGVPTAAGTYDFTVSVADIGQGGSVSHNYSLHVGSQLLRPEQANTTVSVTDAEGFKFTDTDSIFGPAKIVDSEGFHFADADSVFTPLKVADTEGFKFTDTVSIFGPDKPSDAEGFHFGDNVVVMTSAMLADPETFHFGDTDVVAAKVGISPATAPAGMYSTAYSQTFLPAGNTGTATFTPTGTLPSGLSFTTTTGQTKISGTPTQTGTFPFTIKVVDSGAGGTSTVGYSLVINPASQTINLGALPSPTYGGANFTLSASATSGGTVTIASTSALATGSNPFTPVGAGSASFQASVGATANYGAATLNFNVSISPAPLIVRATNATRAFDQPNPSFSYSFGTFVNGDTSSVVSGVPQLSGTAQTLSAVSGSPYLINISRGTLAAANYNFNFSPATLTVTQAPQTITFYPLPTLTHGSTFPLSARSSSGLPVSYSVTGGSITNNILTVTASSGSLVTVTAAQAGNGNYSAATSVVWSFTAQ